MTTMFEFVARLGRESDGQDLIEYALLAAFIALAAAGSLGFVGNALAAWYTAVGGFIGLIPIAP